MRQILAWRPGSVRAYWGVWTGCLVRSFTSNNFVRGTEVLAVRASVGALRRRGRLAGEFSFQELILRNVDQTSVSINPKTTRLVRHDYDGHRMWTRNPADFHHWVSFQAGSRDPYLKCDTVFHFVPSRLPGNRTGALFVGAHRIADRWEYGGPAAERQPALFSDSFSREAFDYPAGTRAFDLQPLELFEEFSERVLIQWSPTAHGGRAWSQWWKQVKPIVELRAAPIESPFPGFQTFQCLSEEVELLPSSWQQVLSAVCGIYLLVCRESGVQYVGSAYGEQGLYGRWLNYARTGHGGNVLLKKRKANRFHISILEVVSSAVSVSELIQREQQWKAKLGTRAFGLNAN